MQHRVVAQFRLFIEKTKDFFAMDNALFLYFSLHSSGPHFPFVLQWNFVVLKQLHDAILFEKPLTRKFPLFLEVVEHERLGKVLSSLDRSSPVYLDLFYYTLAFVI